MSKWLLRVLALCVALMVFISTVAFAAPYNTPIGEAETPSGVESYFDAAVLIDLSTNSELYSKDADRVFTPVGGAVNLMAAYIVWQEAEWEREIPIIEDVLELSPSSRKLELRPGSRWLIKDLTAGMLLHGAQDASLVLCDHVAGSQESFVQLMNDYAQELGMANTVYMNPLGAYAEGQATTASDMLLLARAIAEIGALRDLLGGSEYDAINGQAIQHRMAIMHESSPNYDERVKGFTEGSTATAGTNTLLYAVEGERACLFIGYKEIDDQLGCQNAAAALIDFFLDAYTLFDASAIVGQLLEEKPISFESGAVVTLAMAEANCSILVENSVLESGFTGDIAEFSLSELPIAAESAAAGADVGTVELLYQGQKAAQVLLVVGGVAAPVMTPVITPDDTAAAEPSAPAPVTISEAADSVEIPVYSAEDWDALRREPSAMDKYGAYIIITASILLAGAVLLIARGLRKRIR